MYSQGLGDRDAHDEEYVETIAIARIYADLAESTAAHG